MVGPVFNGVILCGTDGDGLYINLICGLEGCFCLRERSGFNGRGKLIPMGRRIIDHFMRTPPDSIFGG